MSLRASTSNGHVLEPSTAETLVNFDCNLVPDTPPTEENTPLPDLPNIRTGPYANASQLPPRIPLTARPESTLSLPRSSYTPIRREATMSLDSSPFVIPPTHEHRTLVLCFDGTGDQFDADNSNIVEFFSMLKKDDRSEQMCYYQSGIGTYISPKAASPTSATLAKSLDMMMAWHLDAHVMDGYEFLMQNYQTGDRICLFGFSRGAYTARGLAGMLHKVGLLPPDNWQQVPFAYKLYTEVDKVGWEQSTDFKHSFCVEVDIEFVGVWDTVDSVGIIPRRLPFTTSNTLVRTFRHAVALDERRAKFKANLWNMPTEEEQQLGTPRASPSNSRKSSRQFNSIRSRKAPFPLDIKLDPEEEEFLNKMEARFSEEAPKPTDVREVWFSGCHCDVGGGSVKNSTRNSLARISLRWMVRECFLSRTGIMFDTERLRDIGLEPTTLSPFVTPRPPPLPTKGKSIISPEPEFKKSFTQKVTDGVKRMFTRPDMSASTASSMMSTPVDPFISEEEEELRDALQPKYDQLKHAKFWYLLEVIPMEFRRQLGDGSTESRFGINFCRPREVPHGSDKPVEIHRSVKMRMEAMHATGNKKGKEYVPKAFRTGWPKNIKWVD